MKQKHFIFLIFCALSPCILHAQTGPGTIHAEAIKVEFDECQPFKEGFAVIQKGTAFAVIDYSGRFVIPYGKYNNIPDGFVNGYCMVVVVKDGFKQLYGYVDQMGTLVIPCIYSSASSFDSDGFAYVSKLVQLDKSGLEGSADFVIDKKGKETKTTLSAPYYVGSSARLLTKNGIVDRSGKILVSTKGGGHPFSEGLAAVSKTNEFGEVKWGFIDTNGNTVIPFQFSNEPGDFSGGRAVIIPPTPDEFDYGFIDKKGNVVIKIKADNKNYTYKNNMYRQYPFSKSGWAISCIGMKNGGDILIDTAGTFYDFTKLLKLVNPKATITKATILSINEFDVMFNSNEGTGIASVYGEIILHPASYLKLGHFDTMSGLARAQVQVKNSKQVKGYVNANGEFLIVQKGPSGL